MEKYVLKKVKIILWQSLSPVVIAPDFWKLLDRFINITSMEVWFDDLNQVFALIRFVKSKVSHKSE